jgi:predicted ribonuclease YlaK
MRPARTLVVPDTNIFLDPNNDFANVEWQQAVGDRRTVRVVVPLIVVHELDRSKRNGNKDTSRRARDGLHWLAKHLRVDPSTPPEPLTDGTTVEVYVHEGPSRPEDADGMIIHFARQVTVLSGQPTILMTRDLGMRLRAQSRGLDVRQLPDDRD